MGGFLPYRDTRSFMNLATTLPPSCRCPWAKFLYPPTGIHRTAIT